LSRSTAVPSVASPCPNHYSPPPSERSAARLAHQSGGLGVPSSNLGAPTNHINRLSEDLSAIYPERLRPRSPPKSSGNGAAGLRTFQLTAECPDVPYRATCRRLPSCSVTASASVSIDIGWLAWRLAEATRTKCAGRSSRRASSAQEKQGQHEHEGESYRRQPSDARYAAVDPVPPRLIGVGLHGAIPPPARAPRQGLAGPPLRRQHAGHLGRSAHGKPGHGAGKLRRRPVAARITARNRSAPRPRSACSG
jgi:hypothetical protein